MNPLQTYHGEPMPAATSGLDQKSATNERCPAAMGGMTSSPAEKCGSNPPRVVAAPPAWRTNLVSLPVSQRPLQTSASPSPLSQSPAEVEQTAQGAQS